jgi:hypothetical protein
MGIALSMSDGGQVREVFLAQPAEECHLPQSAQGLAVGRRIVGRLSDHCPLPFAPLPAPGTAITLAVVPVARIAPVQHVPIQFCLPQRPHSVA